MTTSLLFYQLLQISTVCKIHDYAEVTLLCFVDFAESYYVWMIEHFQNLCFLDSFLALAITHSLDVDLLDDTEFFCRFSLDQECFAKGTLPKKFNFAVNLKLLLLHDDAFKSDFSFDY
jgi:hypothetical protein